MFFASKDIAAFTKAEVKALAAHASTDATRQHLNAVLVDFAAGAAVTTDGHRLAKCNSAQPFPDAEPCLIPLDAWERAGKLCRKACQGVIVVREGQTARLVAVDQAPAARDSAASFAAELAKGEPIPLPFVLGTVECRQPDAVFPPYGQVIPGLEAQGADTYESYDKDDKGTKPRAKVFGMNTRYLGDIGLCAIAAGCERTMGAELHLGPGPLDPLLALCKGPEGSWTVVVMPMRI